MKCISIYSLNLNLDLAEATPEELAKRELKNKMKEEYLAALSHERKILSNF